MVISTDATLYSFLCFFTIPATTGIYTLSLHDALPIYGRRHQGTDFRAIFYDQGAGQRNGLGAGDRVRSEEHTSELQSQSNLVCRLLLDKKKIKSNIRLIFGIVTLYVAVTESAVVCHVS